MAAAPSEYQNGFLDGLRLGWLMGELKGQANNNNTALQEYNRLVPEYNAKMEEVFGPGVVSSLPLLDPVATSGYRPVQELIDTSELFGHGDPIINDYRQGVVHEIDGSFKNPTVTRGPGSFVGLVPEPFVGSPSEVEDMVYGNLGGV